MSKLCKFHQNLPSGTDFIGEKRIAIFDPKECRWRYEYPKGCCTNGGCWLMKCGRLIQEHKMPNLINTNSDNDDNGNTKKKKNNNTNNNPFLVLALPGLYLLLKYKQYKKRRKENVRRKVTEKELQHLNLKINELLHLLEDTECEIASTMDEQCVICINSKAIMETVPCGHQVLCRKCFVKTIQIAIQHRLIPLRCIICRAKILRLKTTDNRMPSSISGYSIRSSVQESSSLYSFNSGSISSGGGLSNSSCPCLDQKCKGAHSRVPPKLPPIDEDPSPAAPTSTSSLKIAQKIITQTEGALKWPQRSFRNYRKIY